MHFGHKESDQQQGKEINIVTALESFSTLLQYGINNAWRWCSSECCRKFDLKYKRWEKFRLFTAGRDVPINADRVNYSIVGVVDCELERKQITSRALMPKFDLFSHQYENRCLIVPFKTTGSNERWVVRDSTTFSHIDDKDFIIPSCTTAHHRTASAEENKHRRNKPKKCPIFRRPPFSSFACDRTLTSSFSLHSTGPLSTHEYIISRSVSVCHHVNNHKRIGEYWWWRWHTEYTCIFDTVPTAESNECRSLRWFIPRNPHFHYSCFVSFIFGPSLCTHWQFIRCVCSGVGSLENRTKTSNRLSIHDN